MKEQSILIPRQPYMVMVADHYYKKVIAKYGISHFYYFKAKEDINEIPTSFPDGCVDLMFFRDKKSGKYGAEIYGSLMTPHPVEIHPGYEYFGLRFLPGMNPLVVDARLGELIELVSPLQEMIKNPYLEEQICMAESFENQIYIFMEQYGKEYDEFFGKNHQAHLNQMIIQIILSNQGNVSMKEIAEEMVYSDRQIRRIFTGENGISPKKFSNIVRFQNTVQYLEQQHLKGIHFTEICNEKYYDQSHMIREFRTMAKRSPSDFIKELKGGAFDSRLKIIH